MLQTAVGKRVNDLILKSLPEGGQKSFQGLSESNSVWLQYFLTNKGRSQIPPIENNQNPQARQKKNPFCILLRPKLVCYEAWEGLRTLKYVCEYTYTGFP